MGTPNSDLKLRNPSRSKKEIDLPLQRVEESPRSGKISPQKQPPMPVVSSYNTEKHQSPARCPLPESPEKCPKPEMEMEMEKEIEKESSPRAT